MNTNCPKKSIAATFFYLENLRKEGVFNATPENIQIVVEKIKDVFEGYKDNVEKYRKNSQFVVGDSLNFDLITKSTLSSVNFENKVSQNIPLSKGQLVSTKFDIKLENASEFKIDEDFDYSKYYNIAIPELEKNQLALISKHSNIHSTIKNLFIDKIINRREILDKAMKDNTFAETYSSALTMRFNSLNVDSFVNGAAKVNLEISKIAGRSLDEYVITITPDMLEKFKDDNKGMIMLSKELLSDLNEDQLNYIKKKLSEATVEQVTEQIIQIIDEDKINDLASSINKELITRIFEFTKIDTKLKFLLSNYTELSATEAKNVIEDAEVKDLQVSLKPISNVIVSFPRSTKNEENEKSLFVTAAELVYEKINHEDLTSYQQHDMDITEIRVSATSASKAMFEIAKINVNKSPNFFTSQSENLSKSYFYGKEIANDFSNICIDEADKGISGKGVNIYYAIAKSAENVMVGTGTATEGYASGIVPMLGYSGNFTLDSISTNLEEFKTLCDKWSIKDVFIAEVISAVSMNSSIAEMVKKNIINYIHQKKAEGSFDESNFAKTTASELLERIAKTFVHKMDVLAQFDLNQISNSIKRFYEAAYKINEDKTQSLDLSQPAQGIMMKVLFQSRNFLKRYPGIANVGTYANQIGSFGDIVNTSIGTRQTILKRKEKMIMHDLGAYTRLNGNFDDKHKGMNMETILESNNIGIMTASRALKDYSRENMIPQVKNFLAQNFDFFLDSLDSEKLNKQTQNKNIKVILSELQEKIGDETIAFVDVKNAISKSTSQSVDDAKTMYRQALSLDFDNRYFDEVLKLSNPNLSDNSRDVRGKKLQIFKALVELYRDLFLNKENLLSIENPDGKDETILLTSKHGSLAMPNIVSPVFTKIEADKIISTKPSELNYSENTIPEGVNNSVEIFLFKERWRSFTDKKINLVYKHGNDREEEVLDVLGSKNLEKIINSEINEGKNPIIASSRIVGMIANTFDTITAAIQRKDKELPFVLIVNVSDSMAKNFIASVNKDVLKENNIEIVSVTRTMLDATIKQYAKKDVQMSINSNYQSISRGLDLSMQDSIIAAGAFTNGRELVQFLSRLYSVNKTTAEIYMFNGGEDISYAFSEDSISNLALSAQELLDANEDKQRDLLVTLLDNMVLTTSYSNKLNERGYEKMATNQKFMSGEQTDVFVPSSNIVEMSKSFEEIIKNRNENIEKNSITR